MIFPVTGIQSMIEDTVIDRNLALEVKGLKKGLWYDLSAEDIILKRFAEEIIAIHTIHGSINPLNLMLFRMNLKIHGDIGRGNVTGDMNFSGKKMQMRLDFQKAHINEIPLLKMLGIQGSGTIAGRFSMIHDTGRLEFITGDANIETARFSGINVPLNFFHGVRGSLDIRENIVHVDSVYLEGKDISARMKGVIKDAMMDLSMELMPGKSFVENPFFIVELEKYKISPGYYIIPVKGPLSFMRS